MMSVNNSQRLRGKNFSSASTKNIHVCIYEYGVCMYGERFYTHGTYIYTHTQTRERKNVGKCLQLINSGE